MYIETLRNITQGFQRFFPSFSPLHNKHNSILFTSDNQQKLIFFSCLILALVQPIPCRRQPLLFLFWVTSDDVIQQMKEAVLYGLILGSTGLIANIIVRLPKRRERRICLSGSVQSETISGTAVENAMEMWLISK